MLDKIQVPIVDKTVQERHMVTALHQQEARARESNCIFRFDLEWP